MLIYFYSPFLIVNSQEIYKIKTEYRHKEKLAYEITKKNLLEDVNKLNIR